MARGYEPRRITQTEGEQLIQLVVTGRWDLFKRIPDFITLIEVARKADNRLAALLSFDDLADEVLHCLCAPGILTETQFALFRKQGAAVDFKVPRLCQIDPARFWGYIQKTIVHSFIVSYVGSDAEKKKLRVPRRIREVVGVENGRGSQSLDAPPRKNGQGRQETPLAEQIADSTEPEPLQAKILSNFLAILEAMEKYGYGKYAEVLRRTNASLNGKLDRQALAREFIAEGLIRPRKEPQPGLLPEERDKRMVSSLNTLIHRAWKAFKEVAEKEDYE